jgi:hypothetical protein
VKRVLLEVRQDLNIEKVDWRPSRTRFIMDELAPLPNILTPTLNAPETVDFIPEVW